MQRLARVALIGGAVAAETLMLIAGRQNTHYEITLLFFVWVGSPFALLFIADRVAKTWPPLVRTTLTWLTLLITVFTIAAYIRRLVRPPAAQPAAVFVAVPPLSWAVIVAAIGLAFLVAKRKRD